VELPTPFKVDFTTDAFDDLKSITQVAIRHGVGRKYAFALRSIMAGLQTRAADCGEPLYDFPQISLQVRIFSQAPLSAIYGVHLTKPVVVVQSVVNMQPFTWE
jgi:hypothetical protein